MSNQAKMDNEKAKFIPPDSVLLSFKVKKKIEETPDAKYLAIRVFKKYKLATQMKFDDGQQTNSFEHSPNFEMWEVAKMYLPLDTETKIIPKKNNITHDRVGVVMPKKAIIDIDTPKLPEHLRSQFLEYAKTTVKYNFKFQHTESGQYFFLTNKNWEIVTTEPSESSFEVELS